MVESSNSLVIHDDILHTGSAKRGAANGVASLNGAGAVPAVELALAELLANKNAPSGYPGLDASSLLALTQQLLNFFVSSFTYDTATASGDQAITGVGFAPRMVLIVSSLATGIEFSIGFSDGTKHRCIYTSGVAGNFEPSATIACYMMNAAGNYARCTVAMNADGFTLSWTKGGAKTGTATLIYIAVR